MNEFTVSAGEESFRNLRESGDYYVDKTSFIAELLCPRVQKVSLITRPRRFGKTLLLHMLDEFFNLEKKSAQLFDGLAVSDRPDLCAQWMNAWPVVHLTLKNMTGVSFDNVLTQLSQEIHRLCVEKCYLLDSTKADEDEIETLRLLKAKKIRGYELSLSLTTLTHALAMHWEKPVIILLDEYDVPLENAWKYGFYTEMVEFMRVFLGSALKTNEDLKFALLSGCLRIAKESLFTGLNNFKCYGIDDVKFADKLGFTEEEVDLLLKKANCTDKKDLVKEWYDGYLFGENQEIYCPWDIIQYIDDLLIRPTSQPKAYWINTSSNDLVRELIEKSTVPLEDTLETLLSGKAITSTIVDSLNYADLYTSEDALLTLLYLTGYLTRAKSVSQGANRAEISLALTIPNKEIRQIYINTIQAWFKNKLNHIDSQGICHAFWSANSQDLTRELSRLLLLSISYFDTYPEKFYHALLTGLFLGMNVRVSSNLESGHGRTDLLIRDPRHNRSACIEVKIAKDAESCKERALEALEQIAEKEYDAPLKEEYSLVLRWGIAFYKKRCVALCAEEKTLAG